MENLTREISNLSLPNGNSPPVGLSLPPGMVDTSTPLGKQAAEMWSTLDRLSNSDPSAYRKLIESIKEEDEKSRRISGPIKEIKPTAGLCLLSFCKSRRPPRDSDILRPTQLGVRPEAPIELVANDAIYVNICTHERVTPPLDLNDDKARKGKSVIEVEKQIKRSFTTHELMNLEIPLGVDDIRRLPRNLQVQGQDASVMKSTPVWAVDCIVHSWVLLTAAMDKDFKRIFADFILTSVGAELGINFDPKSFKYDKAAYVGGNKQGGKGAEEPVSFNISRLMPPPGKGSVDVAGRYGESSQSLEDELAAKVIGQLGKKSKSNNNRGPSIEGMSTLDSPSTLLQSIKSGDRNSSADSPIRELDGLRLTGLPLESEKMNPSSAELAAADFAQQAASILPDAALVYSNACTVSVSVEETVTSSLVVCIIFNTSVVNIDSLKISECELNVEERRLRLFLPRKLLKNYSGLELENVLVALENLPIKVNPDRAKAKFTRSERRLIVSIGGFE